MPVKDLCRRYGFSDATFYKWRSRLGGLDVSEVRRLREFKSENTKLKKLLAEAMLDIELLKVVARGDRCCITSGAPVAGGKHCADGW